MAADLTNPFYPELVQPPRTELDSLGYRTLLLPDSAESPVNAVQLADGSLDGVIMTTLTLGSSLPHTLAMCKIPLVLMNREVDGAVAGTCVIDNRDGAAKIAGLLAELRHGAVGAVFGPQNTSTGRDREIRLREGLGEHGIGRAYRTNCPQWLRGCACGCSRPAGKRGSVRSDARFGSVRCDDELGARRA
ncbi:type 1 periplasmic-binding domain-containing protein [Streptomyces malaysiensis]|uniref:hypothetical protein n=1 Tax=Streptomyces malaysiensis TaxID=92644 RepID=UPI00321FE564|nr:hypothetical protein [Streptomyces malaysiensis]